MKKYSVIIAMLIILFLTPVMVSAQCAMCKAVAESGSHDAKRVGKGLNNGILYLLATPYLLGGVAFFIWRKNRKKI